MSYIFKFNNRKRKKNKFASSNPCFYHLYTIILNKQNFCWCPYILTQEHLYQRLLFISPAKIEIYAKQLLYTLKFTCKNGHHFQNKGHFYRHASNEQIVNIPLLTNFNRSVMFLRLFTYAYLCTMFIFCVGI